MSAGVWGRWQVAAASYDCTAPVVRCCCQLQLVRDEGNAKWLVTYPSIFASLPEPMRSVALRCAQYTATMDVTDELTAFVAPPEGRDAEDPAASGKAFAAVPPGMPRQYCVAGSPAAAA